MRLTIVAFSCWLVRSGMAWILWRSCSQCMCCMWGGTMTQWKGKNVMKYSTQCSLYSTGADEGKGNGELMCVRVHSLSTLSDDLDSLTFLFRFVWNIIHNTVLGHDQVAHRLAKPKKVSRNHSTQQVRAKYSHTPHAWFVSPNCFLRAQSLSGVQKRKISNAQRFKIFTDESPTFPLKTSPLAEYLLRNVFARQNQSSGNQFAMWHMALNGSVFEVTMIAMIALTCQTWRDVRKNGFFNRYGHTRTHVVRKSIKLAQKIADQNLFWAT